MSHLKTFLRLVSQPVVGAWNILGLGIPGAIGLLLWGLNHPLAAFIWTMLVLVGLFGWAGYRVQRRLDDIVTQRSFLDSLGRLMTLGRFGLDIIADASVAFQEAQDEMKVAGQIDEERWSALYNKVRADSSSWQNDVRKRLRARLNYSYEARFEDDSGLIRAKPPSKVADDYCIRQWQHHEMRLQRLHEIIKELQERWEE